MPAHKFRRYYDRLALNSFNPDTNGFSDRADESMHALAAGRELLHHPYGLAEQRLTGCGAPRDRTMPSENVGPGDGGCGGPA